MYCNCQALGITYWILNGQIYLFLKKYVSLRSWGYKQIEGIKGAAYISVTCGG